MLTVNAPRALTVLHSFVGLGEVQRNGVPFLHGAPCGVHDIHTAVLVVSCNHQNRHGKMPSVIFNFVLMITPPCDHIDRTVPPAL